MAIPAKERSGWRRREFLQLAGGTALSLGLVQLRWRDAEARATGSDTAAEPTDYASWQDVYRDIWRWIDDPFQTLPNPPPPEQLILLPPPLGQQP